MIRLQQPSFAHIVLATTLKRQRNDVRVPLNRHLSLLARSSRRHPAKLITTCHHSHISPTTRCFSSLNRDTADIPATSDTTDILATSTHVPAEPMAWYNLSQYVMDMVHFFHDTTGWSYAACIVVVTTVGRSLLFPLVISSQRMRLKREDVQEALRKFAKAKPNKQAVEARQAQLRKQYNFHPTQLLTLPFANIALTCYMWFGLRWMGYYYPEELATGGILWFPDLTTSDPFFLLPFLSGTASFLMHELGVDHREMSKKQIYFGRAVSTMIFPFLFFAPASVNIFWASNWLMAALQDVAISQPAVRQQLGLVRKLERPDDKAIVFFKDVEKSNGEDEEEVVEVIKPKLKRSPKQKQKRRGRR